MRRASKTTTVYSPGCPAAARGEWHSIDAKLRFRSAVNRRNKKRTFRALWITRINAGARQHGMSYSQFMGKVKANGIELNRKVLADLAMNHPEAFKAIVEKVK